MIEKGVTKECVNYSAKFDEYLITQQKCVCFLNKMSYEGFLLSNSLLGKFC